MSGSSAPAGPQFEPPVGPPSRGLSPVGPPPVEPRGRRGPATWLVVVLTLLAVVGVGVVFVVGIAVGARLGGASSTGLGAAGTSGSGAPSAGEPTGSASGEEPGADAGAGPGGPLDACVVGTWEGVEHTEDWKTEQGDAQLSGLTRTMVFDADGTQTITYDGDEATITTEQGALPAVFDGRVVYRTSTAGGTMSFELVESVGTVTVDANGESSEEELRAGIGDVGYTCEGDELRQEAEGYLSVYTRS